jgi:hypothetical protein
MILDLESGMVGYVAYFIDMQANASSNNTEGYATEPSLRSNTHLE